MDVPTRPAPARGPKSSAEDAFLDKRKISRPTQALEPLDEKSSVDITQKLEKRLAQLNASENVFKRWCYEIITWLVSALCMGGIIAILLYLNDKSLNKWPIGLTIYTVLSKVASAALILPTSEALGQLKWSWFHGKKSKAIWDFEIFDKASRGPWGSILLLFRTKGRSLAALGAILTVLLIANDTFFQQVVDLPERWTLEHSPSTIAKLRSFKSENAVETRGGIEVIQMEQAVVHTSESFFYGNGTRSNAMGNGTSPEIPVSCPTSNCTWPEYETLGVCSLCVSITQLLTFACTTTKADWIANLTGDALDDEIPDVPVCGYFINATDNLPLLLSGYSTAEVASEVGTALAGEALLMRLLPLVTITRDRVYNGSINFKEIPNPLVDVIMTSAPNGAESVYRNETPVAQECVLYWCVKKIVSSYHWADYNEEIITTFANTTPGEYPWESHRFTSPAVNGTDITYTEDVVVRPPGGSNDTYGTSRDTHSNFVMGFIDIFPSFTTVANATADQIFRNKVYKIGGPIHRGLPFNPWMSPNNVTLHVERFATALTNALRSTASKELVYGDAYSNETYVHVQWNWPIFPFILLVLTLVFLVSTIVKTAKSRGEDDPGIWKNSAMPTLIYSLSRPMQQQFTSSSTWNSASPDKSHEVKVRLHPKKGWRVSGQTRFSDTPVVVVRSNQPPPGWI